MSESNSLSDFNSIHNNDQVNRSRSISTKSMAESIRGSIHEVDYIGNGTCQVSQLNLLFKRSIELTKDKQANLSARGLYHRRPEVFKKDISNKTEIIRAAKSKSDIKKTSGHTVLPPVHLFGVYFQRAVGYERLGRLDDAIKDYNICIKIDPKHAPSYYNRGCMYQLKANREQSEAERRPLINMAVSDFNQALSLDPANLTYRQNRSLMLRTAGDYIEAVNDIMICKAMRNDATVVEDLKEGKDVRIDSDTLVPAKIVIDPILYSLRLPKQQRNPENLTPVVDFLALSKFFRRFQHETGVLLQIAYELLIVTYKKGEIIFDEGEPGKSFFIILGGEISIVKMKTYLKSNIKENVTLVKLYRGDAFGENALDGNGIRTAGAVATQPTQLLILGEREYKNVMSHYRDSLKQEVLDTFSHMALFQTWTDSSLDELARHAIQEQYGPNCVIVREGDECKFLYIIKTGMVNVSKSIVKPTPPKVNYNDIMNPEVLRDVELPGIMTHRYDLTYMFMSC
jgi:CRP-like cAMP-binding protein